MGKGVRGYKKAREGCCSATLCPTPLLPPRAGTAAGRRHVAAASAAAAAVCRRRRSGSGWKLLMRGRQLPRAVLLLLVVVAAVLVGGDATLGQLPQQRARRGRCRSSGSRRGGLPRDRSIAGLPHYPV